MPFTGLGWGAVKSALGNIPWQIYAAAFLLAAFPLTYCKGRSDGYQARDNEQAEIERKAAEQARTADTAARKATDTTKTEVEQSNDKARDAANGSDDPIGDAFDSLRATQARSNPATY